jgi:uncharacterized protein (DUF1015 family)
MRIRPFHALVPHVQHAAEVAAVPYDVVNTAEAAALAAGKPSSLLHVDRAEIDLPSDTDPYSDIVYATARAAFQRLQAEGVLLREAAPSVYVYQLRMGQHVQTGLIAGCHIEDYENDVIKKHEKTRKVKEDDRTRLVDTLSAHTGPVFLTYRDVPEVDTVIASAMQGAPLFDLTADDGIGHSIWRVSGAEAARLSGLFAQDVPVAYVADGHHRSASAARVGGERRAQNPAHTGEEDYNWFLGVLFPGSQLQILPYNRLVRDLNGRSAEGLLGEIAAAGFTVRPTASASPASPEHVHVYLGGGQWHEMSWHTAADASPVEALDVSVLQTGVLQPLLGIDDPRISERIDFVGGIRGTQALEAAVDSGRAAVAFSLFPTTVAQLMAISDVGQIMPPKSTWFEPKLRSGLVIQTF